MKSISIRFVLAAALTLVVADIGPLSAQSTFRACRVPTVGAVYIVGIDVAHPGCLDAAHIQFSWTEGGAVADNSITSAKIADGAVATADLADGAVTADKIACCAVGTLQLDDAAVTTVKIADGAITQAKIDPGVSFPLSAGAVGTAELADQAITPSKISGGDQTWQFSGGSGIVYLHPFHDTSTGMTLLRADYSSVAEPQARFEGPSGNLWDYGLDVSGNFTIERNDTPVCTLTTAWSCPAAVGVDAVTSANIADNSIQGADIQNGTITTGKLAGAPSVVHAYLGDGTSPITSPTATSQGSVTIEAPVAGRIQVEATGTVFINNRDTLIGYNISTTAGGTALNGGFNWTGFGDAAAATTTYLPATILVTVDVSAGTHTYHFNAARTWGTGAPEFLNLRLRATFIPN